MYRVYVINPTTRKTIHTETWKKKKKADARAKYFRGVEEAKTRVQKVKAKRN